MPDADDFDVEYFRNLMKGNSPKEKHAPLAESSPPVLIKNTGPTAKPAAAKGKSKPAAGRMKGKNR